MTRNNLCYLPTTYRASGAGESWKSRERGLRTRLLWPSHCTPYSWLSDRGCCEVSAGTGVGCAGRLVKVNKGRPEVGGNAPVLKARLACSFLFFSSVRRNKCCDSKKSPCTISGTREEKNISSAYFKANSGRPMARPSSAQATLKYLFTRRRSVAGPQ